MEARKEGLEAKIKIEEAKKIVPLTKSEILRFLFKAIRKEPAQLIRMLIKKVIVYDDKIEIYYNTSEDKRPGGDFPHQAFCFYDETVHYDNHAWWFTVKDGGHFDINIRLLA